MRSSFAGFSNVACTRRGAWLGASPPEHCAPLRARSAGVWGANRHPLRPQNARPLGQRHQADQVANERNDQNEGLYLFTYARVCRERIKKSFISVVSFMALEPRRAGSRQQNGRGEARPTEESHMTICWHKPGPWRTRCRENHSGHLYISYGRCRSGRRWFWNVQVIDYGIGSPSEHGWSDSEAQALEDAREVVIRFAAGRPAVAGPSHGKASYRLRELNAEKRRARPPSDVKDSRVVEYLYSNSWGSEYGLLHFCRFRITKRTAKRVYYLRRMSRSTNTVSRSTSATSRI